MSEYNPITDLVQRISISASATIRDAMKAVDSGAAGFCILLDKCGAFHDLITDGDIRRALLSGNGMESKLEVIQKSKPITIHEDYDPQEAMQLLNEKCRVIPVLNQQKQVVDLLIDDSRRRISLVNPLLGEAELTNVTECIASGWISSAGRYVKEFEDNFAAFCGTRFAVSCSNGTTALHLALLALSVGPGDEVIVPSLTWISSVNAIVHAGAVPILVDSENETWNMCPKAIEQAITGRTRAILVVHLYGHPANMPEISRIANAHDLPIVEDAAEAHGAVVGCNRVGSIGQIGCFSFFGNKIITTGEGGMVTTDSSELDAKLRMYRDHGRAPDNPYLHPVIGYNYRMTNLQAAVGVGQMGKIEQILEDRKKTAAYLDRAIGQIDGIILPPRASWAENVFWLYSIVLDSEVFPMERDELMRRLAARGVETRTFFVPAHKQPPYAYAKGAFPIADSLSGSGISLPTPSRFDPRVLDRLVSAMREAITQ